MLTCLWCEMATGPLSSAFEIDAAWMEEIMPVSVDKYLMANDMELFRNDCGGR